MHIRPAPQAEAPDAEFRAGVGALIGSVGRAGFAPSLFALAHEAFAARHVTAFVSERDGCPSLLLAENAGAGGVAKLAGRHYLRRHWRMDPVRAIASDPPASAFLVELAASDILDSRYREDCYTAVQLGARLSLCDVRDDRLLRFSLYRPGAFDDAACALLLRNAALLLPLLWRHAEDQASQPDRAVFAARLERRMPEMPRREREICALIAAGLGSEGIALELGISRNTVLTYRKRAYARLRISSQNELLRRLLD